MNSSRSISKQQISELFKRFDTHGDGSRLYFHDFYELLKYKSRQENQKVIDISAARFFFSGAAISDPSQISQNEMEYLFSAFNSTDPVEFAKLVFRAIDKDRKGTIGADELQDSTVIFAENSPISTLLAKAVHEIEGTDQRLNYARFIELTTGEVIEAGFDPYDGKLPKSQCCLLI
ncbi:hypothetical protein TRFO_07725 [Tritrichomonas foetus]|uniref:EF-hand domain-containing protein n=1 Tax=Tritrichomonas foetus TaxID=1144522 RepID=A0A1J4JPI9_9EUKA|nr:hypothetical protein TRFO_07725 [Tritrichomonas foetus]|eukprot:OHT01049.1 hypothetical protein TRFO_07725 [Tritrichomonas foetus]